MTKSAVTLESLDKKIDSKIDALTSVVDRIATTVEDMQTSVGFLVEHAVMREEVSEMIDKKLDERLIPMESRLLSAMDVIIGKNQTFEGESLALRYHHDQLDRRVGVIERKMGLSNAV